MKSDKDVKRNKHWKQQREAKERRVEMHRRKQAEALKQQMNPQTEKDWNVLLKKLGLGARR